MNIAIRDSKNTKQFEDGLIELTDANKKVFKVKIDDIVDASTILSNDCSNLNDSSKNIINFASTITDSEGNIMDEESLISDVKSGLVSSLDVTFEATHSGSNANHSVYSSDSMEEDAKSWQYPFAKPLIKNHDMHEEPIGRVIDAYFGQSEFAEDRDTINVTFRVSDEVSMAKFADKRYQTMSIGATAGHIICNVCGKDILKDNKFKFCGHWRGEQYANQTATWTAKKLTYKEGSVVNNPADSYAQVKRIRVIKLKEGTKMANKDENKDALNDIDVLISDNTQATETVIEENNIENNVANDSINDNNESKENTVEETVEKKLEDAQAKIAELEQSINALTDEKSNLEEKLNSKEEEIKGLNDAVTEANDKITTVKDQAKRLALLNKELLVDNLKNINNSITDEELEGKTAKEINDMIEDAKTTTRDVAPAIANPGAAVNDSNTIIEDEDKNDTNNNVKTMKDFEEVLNNFFK